MRSGATAPMMGLLFTQELYFLCIISIMQALTVNFIYSDHKHVTNANCRDKRGSVSRGLVKIGDVALL